MSDHKIVRTGQIKRHNNMKPLRVLYLMRSHAHFFRHETIIKFLCNNGHNVEVLIDPEGAAKDHLTDRAIKTAQINTTGLSSGWSIRRNDRWKEPLYSSRRILNYTSYLSRVRQKEQSSAYMKRHEQHLGLKSPIIYLKRHELGRSFLSSNLFQSTLRTFDGLVPPDSSIVHYLESNRPDVVVTSPHNKNSQDEFEYIKAAKKLGIPTTTLVFSWDNLTTKGLLYVIPDLIMVWNQNQFNTATKIHKIPSDKIVITGAPVFDGWIDSEKLLMERKLFNKKTGLDNNAPFLLYLGSAGGIVRDENRNDDETWLILKLLQAIHKHPNPHIKKMKILVRPHPAHFKYFEQLEEEQVMVWPKRGELPDSEQALQIFYNSLHYCVATFGINTSAMLEAIIADKPCITILTERYNGTQSEAVHFQYLLNADVLGLAHNAEDCVTMIEELWGGNDSKKEARHRFVQKFIRPRGLHRPAGEVAAQVIELVAHGKNAAEIDSIIGNGSEKL